MGHFKQIIEF